MKVKYFAWVRERIGKAEETVEPPASVRTVDDLIAWLAGRGETYAYAFETPRVIRRRRRRSRRDRPATRSDRRRCERSPAARPFLRPCRSVRVPRRNT